MISILILSNKYRDNIELFKNNILRYDLKKIKEQTCNRAKSYELPTDNFMVKCYITIKTIEIDDKFLESISIVNNIANRYKNKYPWQYNEIIIMENFMIKIYLDTETTGFTSNDEVCQLSYVMEVIDDTTKESTILMVDDYCFPQNAKMSKSAEETHGISLELLRDFPKLINTDAGMFLMTALDNFQNVEIYAHNAKFDVRLLKQSGIDVEKAKIIDTLGIKELSNFENKKIETICKDKRVIKKMKKTAKAMDIDLNKLDNHNAAFDALCVYSMVKLWA